MSDIVWAAHICLSPATHSPLGYHITDQVLGLSVQLASIHPRLIHSLILLDPVIQRQTTQLDPSDLGKQKLVIAKTTQLSTYRRDKWPSRKAAAESFKRNPFYQAWDPRVLERWIQYGLRDLPTPIYPHNDQSPSTSSEKDTSAEYPVTLRTTLHQEVFTFSRPNYDGPPGFAVPVNKVTHPDLDPDIVGSWPFYRPEPYRVFTQLPHLRPSVLYIFGGKSDMSSPTMMADKLNHTGTGLGGSGGILAGRVKDVVLKENGHLVAQEAPVQCAEETSKWLGPELQRWKEDEKLFRDQWSRKSKVEKMTIDHRWKEHVPAPVRPKKEASKSKL